MYIYVFIDSIIIIIVVVDSVSYGQLVNCRIVNDE